jgi:hypothetical protein
MTKKHVRALSRRNDVLTESHSDDQNVGYFLITLWTVLIALGSNEPPLFITIRLLQMHKDVARPCASAVI